MADEEPERAESREAGRMPGTRRRLWARVLLYLLLGTVAGLMLTGFAVGVFAAVSGRDVIAQAGGYQVMVLPNRQSRVVRFPAPMVIGGPLYGGCFGRRGNSLNLAVLTVYIAQCRPLPSAVRVVGPPFRPAAPVRTAPVPKLPQPVPSTGPPTPTKP
ncbi:MAG: hypothetical protein ACR2M0_15025 [Chloroflexia bacterium]